MTVNLFLSTEKRAVNSIKAGSRALNIKGVCLKQPPLLTILFIFFTSK